MRFAGILFAIGLVCSSGCMTNRLRQRTINQGSTLSEMQYQMVLGNLALLATNPAAIPWHVNLREGTTQITDSANAGALVDLGPPAVTQPQVFGSRTAVAQWGMSPVIDSLELRLLRIAYRRAHGAPDMPSAELLDELAQELKDQLPANSDLRNESELFYELESRSGDKYRELDSRIITTNDTDFCTEIDRGEHDVSPLARNVHRKVMSLERDLAAIGPGWFCVGCKRDIPKAACYVGRCGDCYVWVLPEGCEALTELTFTVLKLSTLIKETQTLISPGSVKFSPGDRGG
jgi:hypothetical protein